MSTLSNGRRTHNCSLVGELPVVVTAYVTWYAIGTENDVADDGCAGEVVHQKTAATANMTAIPMLSANVRRRRGRGATARPGLGRRGGAFTAAPWPSVLVITSSVQVGLETSGA